MMHPTLRARLDRLRHRSEKYAPIPEELPFPTAAQLDLLKAALLSTPEAATAWHRWKARGLEFENIDDGSVRMLSQLWLNREAAGLAVEDYPLLKGVYRHVLANNAVKLADGLAAAQLLNDAAIPALFIKGAAMIARTGLLGLRRINDVDVLVPEDHAHRAVALLSAAGYEDKGIGAPHSWDCRSPNGSHIDLHWWAFKTAGDDECVFTGAQERELLGKPVLVPSATESLIGTVADAFLSIAPNGAPMRWIADAMRLLRNEAAPIEWESLLRRARRPGLTSGLAGGLDFLATEFGAPIPEGVVRELQRRPVGWQERWAHRASLVPGRFGHQLPFTLLVHQSQRLNDSNGPRMQFVAEDARLLVRGGARVLIHAAFARGRNVHKKQAGEDGGGGGI